MKSVFSILIVSTSTVLAKSNAQSSYEHPSKVTHADIDTTKRPVIGVLTEPLRGDIVGDSFGQSDKTLTYIPKPHVQFLEQAGVRVVPVDYRLPTEERYALYDQLNGVYMPGDSHTAVTDDLYKMAFYDTLNYQEQVTHEQQEHFPLFLMGNSLTTLVRAKQSSSNHLTAIKPMRHESFEVKLIVEPSDSYLFNQMSPSETQAVFNTAKLFNKEVSGLRIEDLTMDSALKNKYKPLAVFATDDEQVVAIAEGVKVPLYAFAYGIELIQFYFENATENLDDHVLDHSLVARKHAQYIAN